MKNSKEPSGSSEDKKKSKLQEKKEKAKYESAYLAPSAEPVVREASPAPIGALVPGPDYTLIALVASVVSYVVYNALFLAAQLWEAFATLAVGLYYVLLFLGHYRQHRTMLLIGTGFQAVATFVLIGLFVFFMAEIFVPHSLVYQVLTYIKNQDESQRVKIARDCSIAMAVDSFITALLHFWALFVCFLECRSIIEGTTGRDEPFEAMAINTELEIPEEFTIPRLRTTSAGEIVGTMRSKFPYEHHRSMPPPSRY
ncbi:hypothetical protein Q1695_001818 [Nippostrongylus brasiliensis]|nr:hypothetical protein Q1695_001818 [Nippostrongylus brasiliensis]